MKPHLKLIDGIWFCGAHPGFSQIGLGYTPMQAYDDWLLRELSA